MRWQEAPADSRANLETLDRFSGLRNGLRQVADKRDRWAGIPMPLEGERLVVEPNYPDAEKLMEIGAPAEPAEDDAFKGAKIRNTFWSWRWRSDIVIYEHNGKISWGVVPSIHHLTQDLKTLGCADAWGVEQESNAAHTLAGLVSHRQFKQYMLTGTFLESSRQSGLTYLFRRLKPTVAITPRKGELSVLCALCLHPIAYYSGSWAGAMCPTDDVIAHLMLMRGDEAMFWRRANQHPSWRPEAGL